ncbi:hypothetical protein GGTG_11083 [Gaeumannomyces tritici R3-111a-1]|uniref:Zn(2)-C6 fungal-type domain-containing protein n=1 Tax=Gaeumannomyces tritici (strain R3-111a-1) TaxID=644352 RepID=J3PC60_GAET3|nr:hypothetical protein GGTG_11083 [Gaeumannomyces tritici R3-111a-1]EJT71830.1 hypothetical protein GGTG_11083 [Gaeumannomyces tritici R3-111a-1]
MTSQQTIDEWDARVNQMNASIDQWKAHIDPSLNSTGFDLPEFDFGFRSHHFNDGTTAPGPQDSHLWDNTTALDLEDLFGGDATAPGPSNPLLERQQTPALTFPTPPSISTATLSESQHEQPDSGLTIDEILLRELDQDLSLPSRIEQQAETLTRPGSPQQEQLDSVLTIDEILLRELDQDLSLPSRIEQQAKTLTLPGPPPPPATALPWPMKGQTDPFLFTPTEPLAEQQAQALTHARPQTYTLPSTPSLPATAFPAPPQSPAAASSSSSSKNNKRKANSAGPSPADAPKKKRRVLSANNTCAECRRKKIACKPAQDDSGRCAGCVKKGVACERKGLDGRTHKHNAATLADEVAAFKRAAMSIVYLIWLCRTGRLHPPMLSTVRGMLETWGPHVACSSAAGLAGEGGPDAVMACVEGAAADGSGTWPTFVQDAHGVAQDESGGVKLTDRRRGLEVFRTQARDFLLRLRAVLAACLGDLPEGLPQGALVAVGQVIWPYMHDRPTSELLARFAEDTQSCLDGPECAGHHNWVLFAKGVMEKARNLRFRENGEVKELAERECFAGFGRWADVERLAAEHTKL